MRIGVHTGVAVIGKAGPGHVHGRRDRDRRRYAPTSHSDCWEMGEPESSLVISGETKRLLRGEFALQPLGMRSLKGLSRKVEVFLVSGETVEDSAGHRARHRSVSRLVDRGSPKWASCCNQKKKHIPLFFFFGVGAGEDRAGTYGGDHRGAWNRQIAAGIGVLIARALLPDSLILAIQASASHQNTPRSIPNHQSPRACAFGIRRDEDARGEFGASA